LNYRWFNSDCAQAKRFYNVNYKIGKGPITTKTLPSRPSKLTRPVQLARSAAAAESRTLARFVPTPRIFIPRSPPKPLPAPKLPSRAKLAAIAALAAKAKSKPEADPPEVSSLVRSPSVSSLGGRATYSWKTLVQ
jgi:hypothetical protein